MVAHILGFLGTMSHNISSYRTNLFPNQQRRVPETKQKQSGGERPVKGKQNGPVLNAFTAVVVLYLMWSCVSHA